MAVAGKYNKYPAQPPPARAGRAPVGLRQFALAVHDVEGVPAACVLLQDRFDLDVNVLLLGAYIGVQGKTLTADDVDAARAVVDTWHTEVVRPLRAVRRRLKSGPAPAPDARTASLRRHVAGSELDAELVELDELGRWADEFDAPRGAGSVVEHTTTAMELVVQSYDGGTVDGAVAAALAVIATAAGRQEGAPT
ncbi:TIGR02444 family protein [Mycolicibacterium sp. P9-64]|uniref:TIGR02444 family protein n=1 Tax=Mycolicibacterium sp. P9-64 TaxID=2024612 RepID=UPI001562EC72|nr:TIGR02444 family protein [Mycolicibacterium sp. P9-64]